VRFIKIATSVSMLTLEHANLDYSPHKKYLIEKTNAYDPTLMIRREPYYEDSIKIDAPLSPTEYSELKAFLMSEGKLYVEYYNEEGKKQFPVIIEKYPAQSDDLRYFADFSKIELKSIYKELSPINYDEAPGWGESWGLSWGF
jgi:hypothetical protein